MIKTVEVVDSFFPSAEVLRQQALAVDWHRAPPPDAAWLGRSAVEFVPDSATLGALRRLTTPRDDAWDRGARACFALTDEATADSGVWQLDEAEWTAIVWLCDRDERRGGISFHLPRTAGQTDPHADTETMFIPTAFNRLTLIRVGTAFRPRYRLGGSPDTAGLTAVIRSAPV